MKEFRLRMVGKPDRNGNDYYFTTTAVPVFLDLSQSVIHVYPYEDDEGSFGADLVVRKYDPNLKETFKEEEVIAGSRRRRHKKEISGDGSNG